MSGGDEKLIQHDFFGGAPEPYGKTRAPSALAQRMRDLARPDMVRAAPDRQAWVPKEKTREPPKFCLCRWSPNRDGTFAPLPVSGRMVRLTSELIESLGFLDKRRRRRWETLMRLSRAGYIDIVHTSPGCYMLDLDSWYRHLADCAENPEMWEEGGEDRKNYLHKNGLGGWRGKEKSH